MISKRLAEDDREGLIVCPFCGDDGFDRAGLKGHLVNDCLEYKDTEISPRLFITNC